MKENPSVVFLPEAASPWVAQVWRWVERNDNFEDIAWPLLHVCLHPSARRAISKTISDIEGNALIKIKCSPLPEHEPRNPDLLHRGIPTSKDEARIEFDWLIFQFCTDSTSPRLVEEQGTATIYLNQRQTPNLAEDILGCGYFGDRSIAVLFDQFEGRSSVDGQVWFWGSDDQGATYIG